MDAFEAKLVEEGMEETSLHSFDSIIPRYQGAQADLVEWILKKHGEVFELSGEAQKERLLNVLSRFGVNDKQIEQRFFDVDREEIYLINEKQHSGVDIGKRHEFYSKRSLEVLTQMYQQITPPEHLVHVTCTGYVSPSAPQRFFAGKALTPAITHAYHMGCYASLPAVRIGKSLVADAVKSVDIVHTEICSLHLDPAQQTPEQMVVQTLFADGHIRYRMSRETSGPRLQVKTIREMIVADSAEDMTWTPAAHGMNMTLSRKVPEKIRDGLDHFLKQLIEDAGVGREEFMTQSLFAIHPGGPKIIDSVVEQLGLSEEQVHFSRKVLRERGNMSSATLPHVWKEILESDYQGRVISLAFGPGLTIFGGLFEAKK